MIKLNNLKIGNSERLTIFGGVNVIESKELIFEVAEEFIKNSSKFDRHSIEMHMIVT